jgi:hypothetical protein
VETSRLDLLRAAEAARIGTLGAHNGRWYRTWRQSQQRRATADSGRPIGLEGEDLERALYALLHSNPDIVAVRQAA